MKKAFNIPSILDRIRDLVRSGAWTLEDAAVELHRDGWFNYVPDDEETREFLRL